MKVRLEHISFYLLIGTLLLAIGLGDAYTCPEHCSCDSNERKFYIYNHVKCTSLDGLRNLGKTSDLHSLDLSSLNLTKINNQLDKLTNLSKLDLADNRLSEINALSTKRIRVLNLSGNRITSGKLAKIPSTVKNLNLSHNEITILPENFKRFGHLRSLELAGNPLNCTCETLDIRNWLQVRQVWTEKPIRCMAPIQFKGWSWLQVRQSEVCDPNGIETPRMLPFADPTDENDLMMGDDSNAARIEDIPEHEEGFIPVSAYRRDKRTSTDGGDDNDKFEGSGSDTNENTGESSTKTADELYEGSGDTTDDYTQDHTEVNTENITEDNTEAPIHPLINLDDDDDQDSNETLSAEFEQNESDELVHGSNSSEIIYESKPASDEVQFENDNNSTLPPVIEETVMQVKSSPNDAEYTQSNDGHEKDEARSEKARIDEQEPTNESRSTYILLVLLGVLLVALILYVATKRSKTITKNRRNNNDIESPAQEMLTMNKTNLGKPIQNPVEFIPLMPEKHDTEKKPQICNGEEPLLQRLNEDEHEMQPNENGDAIKQTDEKQMSPTQQLNGNAKPIQNGVHADTKTDDTAPPNDQRQSQSISPKPSRYSPVYSHDTGRVKIRLSETSRPKTPILVNRSASDAVDTKL